MDTTEFELNSLRAASPCRTQWWEMQGSDRVRLCSACKMNVYDVAGLTRAEVEQLVGSGQEQACTRLFRRSDDTVITGDCPIGRRSRLRKRIAIASVATVILAALGGITLFEPHIRAYFAVTSTTWLPDDTTSIEVPTSPVNGKAAPPSDSSPFDSAGRAFRE